MAECMTCACKAVVAIDAITDVARYVSSFTEQLPEGLSKPASEMMDDETRKALHAIKEVEDVCYLKLEDIKADVNLANLTFKNRKWFISYDHILDAKAKFEARVCKKGVV